MDFDQILDQAIEMIRRRGRMSYRALKRQFTLDDDYLKDLKDEILYTQSEIMEDGDRGLVWTEGGVTPIPSPSPQPTPRSSPVREPRSYTPQHLIERILTSHAALQGERKQVTVLFCDLANSTGLAEQLGPETMHLVLNQFFDLALSAVHRYEGTINQFLGDGFMALFGAPIAHEEHARRAVLAALELKRQLLIYNAIENRPQEIELAVRMGLNTGSVVVGAIGDNLRMDYTAIGDTTNVAARLEHEAISNQIVISETTYRLVAGYCTTRPIGELELKGKAGTIAAWEVLATRAARSRLDIAAEQGLTPFVGRSRERHTLNDCLTQARSGHGQVVFLVGEAGIGKSRLLREFRHECGAEEVTWLEGQALSFGKTIAFHPLIDLLKRNFRIEEDDPESTVISKIETRVLQLGEALRPTLPYLRTLLAVDPGNETISSMDPQLRRIETFNALRHLLLRAAEVRLQVIVFEDLHWVDRATEEFLRDIVDSIPASRILCIFTYRPGYAQPFGERSFYTQIVMPTLSTADSIEMAESMLTLGRLPELLETLIAQKAEGNPFFVEEIVKSLQESGAIRQDGARYALAQPIEHTSIPDTIQGVLTARIDRLPDGPKQTLQLASVIGREFTYRLLNRLSNADQRTEAHLQELKIIELIYEASLFPELIYMFKHALTQDVAYSLLLTQRQKAIHREVGCAIEQIYSDRLAEHYEELSYHFIKSEEWSIALGYILKSAKKATQASATLEALTFYDQALGIIDQLGSGDYVNTLMEVYESKADIYTVMSDFEKCRLEYQHLLETAQRVGNRSKEGVACAGIGFALMMSHNFDQSLINSQRAIEIAEEIDDRSVMARGQFVTIHVYALTSKLDLVREEIEMLIDMSRSEGDTATQSLYLHLDGILHNWQGEYDLAQQQSAEGLRISLEHNWFMPALFNHFTYALALISMGRYDEAFLTLKEGLSLSNKVGDEIFGLRLLNTLGWLYMEVGNLDQALDINLRAAEESRQRGDAETIANVELNLGEIFLAQGHLDRAHHWFDHVNQVTNDPSTSDWMRWRYSTRLFVAFGELALAQGADARALQYAEQSLELATSTTSRKYLVRGQRLKGEIALRQQKFDVAAEWLSQALSLAVSVGNMTQLWKTHFAMGRFYAATQQPQQAQEAYQAAWGVIQQTVASIENPDLRTNLEDSPVFQPVYKMSRLI